MNFEAKWQNKKSISGDTLTTDFRVNNRPIFAPKVKKRLMNRTTIFLKIFYQDMNFLGNGESSKLDYFSLMKYFGFIDVNRTVDSRGVVTTWLN